MAKYTFVFMLFDIKDKPHAQTEEEDHIEYLRTQLLRTKLYNNVNIVLIKSAFVNLRSSTSKTFKTTLSWLVPDDTAKNNYKETKSQDLGNINIGSGDTLGIIFSFIKFQFPADKLIVYSNNHSNHFGGLSKHVTLINNNKFAHVLAKKGIGILIHDEKKIASEPVKQNPIIELPHIDMLTYQELSTALKNGFTQGETKKVDLLILVACYSNSIDNLVIFKDTVDYLFSSEGIIFFDVIDLSKLIENIVDQGSISQGLNLLFSNFEKDWENKEFGELNKKSIFNIINLSAKDRFVDNLNELLKFIINDNNVLTFIRRDLRTSLLFPFCDTSNIINKKNGNKDRPEILTHCVDFIHFLNILYKINTLKNEVKLTLNNLIEAIKEDIELMTGDCQQHINTRINKVKIDEREIRPFYGTSCFLPLADSDQDISFLEPNTYEQVASGYSPFSKSRNSFAKKTLWPELIQAIYKIN